MDLLSLFIYIDFVKKGISQYCYYLFLLLYLRVHYELFIVVTTVR